MLTLNCNEYDENKWERKLTGTECRNGILLFA